MSKMSRYVMIGLAAFMVIALVISPAAAASTTKTLSTNFTLVNFGDTTATVNVDYIKSDGSAWDAADENESFTIPGDGGQKIIRQYQDLTMTAGKGSAVISSNMPLGAVVQIQARGQVATSGAYSGYSAGSQVFYVPLAIRRGTSGSGTTNSQIIIQNTGSTSTTVEVEFVPTGSYSAHTETFTNVQPGASVYYDLDEETDLAVGWTGSAVVSADTGDTIAVVSNFFTGLHAMQSFNAFSAESVATKWYVPLFLSRNSNGLNSPVAVQNLSGGSIAIGNLDMTCTPNSGSVSQATLNLSNTAAIPDKGAYYFNPFTDTSIPAEWFGSCVIDSGSAEVVAFVQVRYIGVPTNLGAAAYEAIPVGTDPVAYFPLVVKRGSNGFATAVTIQNISGSNATVDLIYTPSPDYAGSQTPITINDLPIDAGESIVRNHRTTSGEPTLPNDWFGTLKVVSNGPAISGFVQLTYITTTAGDTFQAHNAFTAAD